MLSRVIVVVVCGVVIALTLAVGMIEPESQTAANAAEPFVRHPLEPLPDGWDRSEIHAATRIEFSAGARSFSRRLYWDQSGIHEATRLEGDSILVAWSQIRRSGERSLFIETCVVVTREIDGHWNLAMVYRHPRSQNPGSGCHSPNWSLGAVGNRRRMRYRSLRFKSRPTNAEVYRALDDFGWRFESSGNFEIVDGAVLTSAWRIAFGQPPR